MKIGTELAGDADPRMVSIGASVHCGDFSRIIAGFYSQSGYIQSNVDVKDNSAILSQSLILPRSIVEKDVILGATSVAPLNSVLQSGGVYMSGKGYLKLYDDIRGLPEHNVFGPGKKYTVIDRLSNSLSADDDARIDARGAALGILSSEKKDASPLLDSTLKTGKAFYARTVSDFATWLVCGLAAREEHVKRAPHVRNAVWTSPRQADCSVDLHYYSNICRLFRFKDGQEMYVKFKLRPSDENIGEDFGKVEPSGILPPETGSIPRGANDTRPLLFLAENFENLVSSPNGVCYIFQLQVRPIPQDEAAQDIALNCMKPWDETEFPYTDVGKVIINENLTKEGSERLEFNPFLRCHEVDVIQATSSSQSASIDHGRSLVYEICQHLRNGDPLPEAWRVFLEQADVKVDLSGCPMAASLERNDTKKVTLSRPRYLTTWAVFAQPLLQTILPSFLLGLIIYFPLNLLLHCKNTRNMPVHWTFPFFWVSTGVLAASACVGAKHILVGKKREDETVHIWSGGVFMDTIWQTIRTVVGD
ncbi:hypothetical protein NL676_004401 [Syzygium grande]|nr:hypothetical protein NL676_004401 [Syzygium grande]